MVKKEKFRVTKKSSQCRLTIRRGALTLNSLRHALVFKPHILSRICFFF